MEPAYRRCCGIDVHKKTISVCVLPPVDNKAIAKKEETFRTFTRDLRRLRNWLRKCRVTDIILESTGQYWRPIWNILEEAFPKMVLINPLFVKALAGHKTDRLDACWLATRLEREQLQGSFVPPLWVRELRDLTRLRVHWLQDLNRVKNRIGQLCECGNLKVSSVASDLFGLSGRKMLAAVIEGKRDAGWMADYAQGKLRGKKAQLELALEGTFTAHQRKLLHRMFHQMTELEQQIVDLNAEIKQKVQQHEELIQRLCTIPGIDRIAAWSVLAEIGDDMTVFADARHLASWAALCPGNCESGGKRRSGKTSNGNSYLRRMLCQCAWAAAHTKGSHLQELYHRIRGRRGHQKAIIAVAHQLLIIIYHVIGDGTVYRELGRGYFDQQNKPKLTRKLVQRLQQLGYYVSLQPIQDISCLPTTDSVRLSQPDMPERRKPGRPCTCLARGVPCTHGRTATPENSSASGGTNSPSLEI